ncbi:MAG: hypothetical protein WCS94_00250 [Verrucomicrobiota bacterium]
MKSRINSAKIRWIYILLPMLLWAGLVQASLTLNSQLDQGTADITQTATSAHVVMAGPAGNFYPSYDQVSFSVDPLPADKRWLITINWTFNSGDSSSAAASLTVGGLTVYDFASHPAGTTDSGSYTFYLPGQNGDLASSILFISNETGADKAPATFSFDLAIAEVPEPPTACAAVLLGLMLAGGELRRRWGRASVRDHSSDKV